MLSAKEKTRVGWGLAALVAVLAVVGCVTVDDKGDGDDDSDSDGTAGAGAASGTGAGSTGNGYGSEYVCCLGSAHYACPDQAAFDKCVGFDMEACMAACAFDDFECQDGCFMQLESATHDPSDCVEDASVDCGGSGPSTGAGPGATSSSAASTGGPDCSGELSGCDYDSDCCSGNCTSNTCYGTSFGNPCEYDSDCDSSNCYDGICQ